MRSYWYSCANAGILEGEICFLFCCVLLRLSFSPLVLLSATSVCVCVSFKLPIMCDIEVVLFMERKKKKKHKDDEWREWKVQNLWIAFVSPVRSCECCQCGAMMLPCVFIWIFYSNEQQSNLSYSSHNSSESASSSSPCSRRLVVGLLTASSFSHMVAHHHTCNVTRERVTTSTGAIQQNVLVLCHG